MKNQALLALHEYWKDTYNQVANGADISDFFPVPDKIKSKFQLEYYPEPFYGYFHEDMSNDILVLLINPGEIANEELERLYSGGVKTDKSILQERSNAFIKNRHLTWSKSDYLAREEVFRQMKFARGKHWRIQKFEQCKKLLKSNDFDFMHTIEYFPLHSKSWNVGSNIQQEWMRNLPSSKLVVDAIEEVSKNHLVKHIIGIGKAWVTLMDLNKEKFELISSKTFKGDKREGYGFFKYKVKGDPNSLPIVIQTGVSMHLAANGEQVQVFREYLELSEDR